MFQDGRDSTTLVQLLRHRAHHSPHDMAYTYLRDGVHEDIRWTYGELDRAARAIAVTLAKSEPPVERGARALLLYSHGVDFISAFFGCLYAGVVPIPAPPPDSARFKRTFPRLRAIIDDADARLILATDAICETARAVEPGSVPWLSSEHVDLSLADAWQEPALAGDDLAYLQYTSGSTSSPKGVMLTHACVIRNLALSRVGWDYTDGGVAVTWMPYFHDYGLVDGLLQPMYSGMPCYVLSPLTFVKRPQRWLEAIHRYRGTHTQAPNFAYELCLEKITPAQRDALDLRSLRTASNGAEPLREATYRRFIEYFAPCGFEPRAYYPSYGMAETTLLVTTKRVGDVLRILDADTAVLEREQRYEPAAIGASARKLISCGPALDDLQLAVVDPQTRRRKADGEIGEIWVADPCVATGYWGNAEATAEVFGTRIEGEPDAGGPAGFLRTGDLGLMHDGELYVTGRLKDLIIIAGVNHYPQDIEWTVQQSHAELRPDHCAAFSVEVDGEEKLVVVAESNRTLDDWQPLFDTVRRAVSDTHELDLHALLVLRKGGVLKTSSGKLQRRGCRSGFLNDSLEVLARWEKPRRPVAPAADHVAVDVDRIAHWLVGALAARLEMAAETIDPRAPFSSYGLTSRSGVELVGELEQWLNRDDLSPTLLWEYPSVDALSAHLSRGTARHAATAEFKRVSSPNNDAIAIIGMACRLPGANTPDEFWQLLSSKGEALRTLPAGRWEGSGVAVAEGVGPGRVTTLRGGFLESVDRFDADLFGIGAREAEIMDPQQRMLLEVAWEAIEDAGFGADALAGSDTGVFVGISTDDYSAWQFADAQGISAYTGPAKALSIAANRISYQFDLLGPSMAIDTACSSSLVALHQASQALRRGECSMALAGGCNLILAPQMSIALSQAGMLAADGRCKTFDAAADGYVRGEGCVLLVLKRLEDALCDGDTITAVIKGSAVNQDGRSNGLTAPNGLAQQRVVRQALADADVQGADISYVEAHGTGTPLGDPIEVKALQAVLTPGRAPGRSCALGAVKTNIGHLEAAAGAAGVLKAALCLRHGEIAPHPTLKQLNPLLELEQGALFIPTERTRWPDGPRLAGVSSFGFGGTNAHLILAAAPQPESPPQPQSAASDGERPLHLLTLSARDEGSLQALASRWREQFAMNPDAVADQCYSVNTMRTRLPERLTLTAADAAGFDAALSDWLAERPGAWQAGTANRQRAPRIGFLFTGQGSQHVGMGRELYRTQPGFKADIDACDVVLRGSLGRSLVELLYAEESEERDNTLAPSPLQGEGRDGGRVVEESHSVDSAHYPHPNPPPARGREQAAAPASRLDRTDVTQPVLFALEYALARLWMRWGVTPVAMLGHSIGEYVAATLAGVFSLEDGLRLVTARARLMHEAPGDGGMVAVIADEAQCRAALVGFEDKVVIAAYNGPRNHVLSGERAQLDQVVAHLTAQGVETRALHVSHAFHSPLMRAAAQGFAGVAARVTFNPARIPVFSNVSGVAGGAELTTAAYWVDHLLKPVRFAQGVSAMHAAGVDAFIEIGPRATLLALAQQSIDDAGMLWLPSLRPGFSDSRLLFDSLAALHVRGVQVDWRGFDQEWPRRRVAVPRYPFQGRRYWLPAVAPGHAVQPSLPFPGKRISSPLLEQTLFENRYDCVTLPLLGEHRVFDQVVVPGAAHLSLVLQAAAEMIGDTPCALRDVIFPQALIIPEPGARRVQLGIAGRSGNDGRAFKLISSPDGSDDHWEEHAAGRLVEIEAGSFTAASLASVQADVTQSAGTNFYQEIWQPAIGLGPQFRWVTQVWRGDDRILACLDMPEQAGAHGYRLHPGLIDSMLQVLTAGVAAQSGEALVPFSFEQFCWLAPMRAGRTWSHIRLRPGQDTSSEVVSDVDLYGDDGRLVAQARGFRARRVASRNLIPRKAGALDQAVYAMRWDEVKPSAVPLTGTCLIIGEQPVALARLARSLQEQAPGLHCLQASTHAHAELLDGQIHLRIDDKEETHRALQSLGPFSAVIYLAAKEALPAAVDAGPVFDMALQACSRVLHLVQAMVDAASAARLVLVTVDAQAVESTDAPRADQAAVWGMAKVIRLEHPELACHCVDLSDADGESDAAQAVLQAPGDLALRGGRMLAPTLVRQSVQFQPAAQSGIRADAAYLVSGGLGALGLRLAEWLVEQGARALLLLGRRPPSGAALERIEAMRRTGVEVQTRALDIADVTALEAVVREQDGVLPIGGVFHLAGVLDDGMLRQQDPSRIAAVLAPKLGGALNLQRLFAERTLDQFVCFSSVAALTGSMGQGTYAAANAALDALMAARRAVGQPGLSIQWGPWAESGMAAAQSERDRQRFADYGIDPIAPADGMALLTSLLAGGADTSAVLPVHWPTYLGQLYGAQFPAMYQALHAEGVVRKGGAAAPVSAGLAESLIAADAKERRAMLERHLQDAVGGVLGLTGKQSIGPRQRLFELGLDSLGAVELRNRLAAALGRNLRATLLFDYPTLTALADHIEHDVLGFAADAGEPEAVAVDAGKLDQLSDDELARMLAAELG